MTAMTSICVLSFKRADILDRNRAFVAEEDDENGKADGCFRRRDRENEHGEHLPRQVVQERREGNKVDGDRQQDKLDRHQNNDDVAAVKKDAEDTQREQDAGNEQEIFHADVLHDYDTPEPD